MSPDRVGTVRRSPSGVVAVRVEQESHTGSSWLASLFRDDGPGTKVRFNYWRSDRDVADWEIIHRPPAPPHPVGTMLRRGGKTRNGIPFWEVAVRSEKGWVVTDKTGPWASLQEKQPHDDEDGAWEVVHGSVDGARAS